eukprot:TRINITY_DN1042_c0_g1_i2.p1 TRINITY_DN1042_c0_g1~~TRINITY_DN1042_c0_g1_i2.p1  ORF type:complete len:270 (+),score=35.10 TRINITY_DN1042_c0_g1_i2:99-908(+)
MIRRPPRSTLSSSSAASDVYKRQYQRRVRGRTCCQPWLVLTSPNPNHRRTLDRPRAIMPASEPIPLFSFQMLLVVLHCLIHIAIVCAGVASLSTDSGVQDNSCDKTYHLFKYCLISLFVYFASFPGYFLAKGGVELPRTRAYALVAVHGGLAVWGAIVRFKKMDKDSACDDIFEDHYPAVWGYWQMCVYSNIVYALLYLFHETVWVRFSNVDWTVAPVAVVPDRRGTQYNNGLRSQAQAQAQHQHGPQDLEAEYQKIKAGFPAFTGGPA